MIGKAGRKEKPLVRPRYGKSVSKVEGGGEEVSKGTAFILTVSKRGGRS